MERNASNPGLLAIFKAWLDKKKHRKKTTDVPLEAVAEPSAPASSPSHHSATEPPLQPLEEQHDSNITRINP